MSTAFTPQHDEQAHRFEVRLNDECAYLAYMDLGKQTLDFYRTFVPNALRGQGLAAALTEAALRYAELNGYTVIASCSYVEAYMQRRSRSEAK